MAIRGQGPLRVRTLRKIGIVDDDDAVRDSLRALLESHMLHVTDFSSGKALLDSGDLSDFDCFILDYQMPGMNGMEVVEALRSRGVSGAAIILSALSVSASSERLRHAGVIAALMKPVSEGELMGWIGRAAETTAASAH